MRIVIPSIQTPFIHGGSEIMTYGLRDAFIRSGHEAEVVTYPFKFMPESFLEASIEDWKRADFNKFSHISVDRVVVLQFPAWYMNHDNKILWLMHQHRGVYDLYDPKTASKELKSLRDKIQKNDSEILSTFERRFSMCRNVSNRLKKFNGISSTPLYHPPFNESKFYCEEPYDYIFFPSRLFSIKRQELLIRAMKYVKSPVAAILGGEGGERDNYLNLIHSLGLDDKVILYGAFSEEEKLTLYARSLGVFFGPFDEDYGYITLEAMLSSKPVITCNDSGGPLEFIDHETNGFVVNPDPEEIAEKIDWLYNNKAKSREMGQESLKIYKKKNISWENVVSTLLGNDI